MQPQLHNSVDHGISKCLPAPSSSCLGLPTIHRDRRTSSEQVPCLQRAKAWIEETCNLLQQAGVRDSCRLGKEKQTQQFETRIVQACLLTVYGSQSWHHTVLIDPKDNGDVNDMNIIEQKQHHHHKREMGNNYDA